MMKGGFGGMNMQALMKQAQAMQAKMAEDKRKLEESVVTAKSGGDMVEVTMNGKYEFFIAGRARNKDNILNFSLEIKLKI